MFLLAQGFWWSIDVVPFSFSYLDMDPNRQAGGERLEKTFGAGAAFCVGYHYQMKSGWFLDGVASLNGYAKYIDFIRVWTFSDPELVGGTLELMRISIGKYVSDHWAVYGALNPLTGFLIISKIYGVGIKAGLGVLHKNGFYAELNYTTPLWASVEKNYLYPVPFQIAFGVRLPFSKEAKSV